MEGLEGSEGFDPTSVAQVQTGAATALDAAASALGASALGASTLGAATLGAATLDAAALGTTLGAALGAGASKAAKALLVSTAGPATVANVGI